jgi:membrane-bound metal-dependent hydrolase YbcI (DUF457 family)
MIAGHFGFAAAVKARERQVPLWALMLATAWLDVVFVPLFVAGVESIDTAPGTSGGYGAAIIHADYTHSLIGALALAGLFGVVAARSWGRRTGLVLAAVVFSHWVLDLIVHRADLPILPANLGGLPRLGFGLWQIPAVSAAVELLLVVIGSLLYRRAALEAAGGAGRGSVRAQLVSALTLLAGVIVLALDAFGILG